MNMMETEFPLPTWDDLVSDEASLRRFHEAAAAGLEKLVPPNLYQRLATTLPAVPPEPLGGILPAREGWFDLMAVLAEFEGGATARQLARKVGLERSLPDLTRLLEHLAERGELRRLAKGAVRYQPKPMVKVLPSVLRQFPGRLPAEERDTFDLAVLAYQEAPDAEAWSTLAQALVALIKAVGWPAAIAAEAQAAPAEWLRQLAGVEPPAYVLDTRDPLVEELRARAERLAEENEALRRQQAAAEARSNELEAANASLAAQLAELEALLEALQPPSVDDFLAGRGHGPLPAGLPEDEVAHWRDLVLATRANRPELRAIAASLADVYAHPQAHQRLTTLSFKDHPYDSLWRARVGKYRIVYGLLGHQIHPVVIGARGEVYEQAVHALRYGQP